MENCSNAHTVFIHSRILEYWILIHTGDIHCCIYLYLFISIPLSSLSNSSKVFELGDPKCDTIEWEEEPTGREKKEEEEGGEGEERKQRGVVIATELMGEKGRLVMMYYYNGIWNISSTESPSAYQDQV